MLIKLNLIKTIHDKLKKYYFDVSELHAQKMIFFCCGLFKKHFNKQLLNDLDFRAWKYGIVEMNYHKIYKNQEVKLETKFDCELNQDEYNYLAKIIEILAKKSPWTLVELSHLSYAWVNHYNVNESKIEESDIDKTFRNIDISFD